MSIERRRSVRREVHWSAKIDIGDGRPLIDCTVLDISDDGARIAVSAPEEAPANFTLYLSPCGYPQRCCRLVWRTQDSVGVEFDDQFHRRNNFPGGDRSEVPPALVSKPSH